MTQSKLIMLVGMYLCTISSSVADPVVRGTDPDLSIVKQKLQEKP
jgi:hypothetical protein